MAYNGFPMTYQPMYYQQPAPAPAPVQMQNGIIWVQGEAGAKSYLVAPNNTVQLWDSESQTIYLKSADASGMPSMKILDYKIRSQDQPQAMQHVRPADNYVTVEEFKSELTQIRAELSKLQEVNHESKHDE